MNHPLPVSTLEHAVREPIQEAIQEHLQKSFSELPTPLAVRVQEAFVDILQESQNTEVALLWDSLTPRQRNDAANAADESIALQVQYALQAEAKRIAGRYTLEEAAKIIVQETNASYALVLNKLNKAARNCTLPTYMPSSIAQNEDGSEQGRWEAVRTFYDECFWDDLNTWIDNNMPKMAYRFKASVTSDVPLLPADVPILREQENKILEWLEQNGYDPKNLPKKPNGIKTAKSYAKAALNGTGVFKGSTTFNKAWQRLREGKEIMESV